MNFTFVYFNFVPYLIIVYLLRTYMIKVIFYNLIVFLFLFTLVNTRYNKAIKLITYISKNYINCFMLRNFLFNQKKQAKHCTLAIPKKAWFYRFK